jgi:hypothetical protein
MRESYRRLKERTALPAERPSGETLKVIPKDQLNIGRWYLGIGRGSNVALWTGEDFLFISDNETGYGEKRCDHWDDGPPFGCFQPFEELPHEKFGQQCRYIHDARSRELDRQWHAGNKGPEVAGK